MREVHSGAEPVDQDLGHLGGVQLLGDGLVEEEPQRLLRVLAAVDEHLDLVRVGADQKLAVVQRILQLSIYSIQL